MTQTQTIRALAATTNHKPPVVRGFFDILHALTVKEAKHGFTLPGFGKLVLVNRKARMGRNPATGAAIKIPAKRVVKFRLKKALKDAVVAGAGA